ALRQRVLKNMSDLSLETTLFNETLSMPVALAPVGLCGMYARRVIPCAWLGFAVQNPATPFGVFMLIALLCGFAGANFASSMGNI
ncbi:alpha-hydroxy-acid oxidizing protein, partial [Salmonella enterica subsp. enterica serovar Montevideo]|nr:alpha-hydroxy-acid oxidizing protein [Salmonella enterica subsp. enterica serovar Montevideo]